MLAHKAAESALRL